MGNGVAVIGAGLAGCEAALVLARRGIRVELFEMRPERMTPAHATGDAAELVCSNSFKSSVMPSAPALLKQELEMLGSPLLGLARRCAVAAGSALAVDRKEFSRLVSLDLQSRSSITRASAEVSAPPADHDACIIATGPLTSSALCEWLARNMSSDALFFYDAIAPIVSLDSIDMSIAFAASRWEENSDDYINCPFTREQYRRFHAELTAADRNTPRSFEQERFFEACLPIEVIAQRGEESLAFGPLKPVGLRDPQTGKRPYAVCQLRRENAAGEALGMVAFQTRLTITEQQRVFRMIPGLENAQFLRYGSIHRNTYIDSPRLLTGGLCLKSNSRLFVAGQLCGNEGYVESIATGHLAALSVCAALSGRDFIPPPDTTALGSLLRHISDSREPVFTPAQFHFGLLPAIDLPRKKIGKKEKRALLCDRALHDFAGWIAGNRDCVPV